MIRNLGDDDAQAYFDFRRQALLEQPFAFESSPEDDRFNSPEAVRQQLRRSPEAIILGAFQEHTKGSPQTTTTWS